MKDFYLRVYNIDESNVTVDTKIRQEIPQKKLLYPT